jgi:hypothetical protein
LIEPYCREDKMQTMRSKLIDDRGAWWDAGARELRKSLHLEDVQGDVRTVLINNLGFVGVSFRDSSVIVWFRPRTVSKTALVALLYWLTPHAYERICLSFALDGQQQQYEIFSSACAAMRRMEALIELEGASSKRPRFIARRGALSALGREFSVVFDHWRAVGGIFNGDEYHPLLTRFASDRYILFEPCPRGPHFNIVRAGKGLHIPDKPSHDALGGSRLENLADRAYGEWTARFYRAALTSQQPQYDHVRALIRWPRTGGVERRYSRLILPCRTKVGRHLLLGISGALATPELDVEPV